MSAAAMGDRAGIARRSGGLLPAIPKIIFGEIPVQRLSYRVLGFPATHFLDEQMRHLSSSVRQRLRRQTPCFGNYHSG